MSASSSQNSTNTKQAILSVTANPTGPKCPFGNAVDFQLMPGGCVWLQGPSGRGKTSLAMHVAGLMATKTLNKLQIDMKMEWDPALSSSERCGVLFQQTTLLDELTVAGNLAVALSAVGERFGSDKERDLRIKQLLDMVGLSYAADAGKRVTELSGGMGRRACLALQLAQKKHVIVLDEPFTGLDHDSAVAVAKELVHLRQSTNVGLILISHEVEIAKLVMAEEKCQGNVQVTLTEPPASHQQAHARSGGPNMFGTRFFDRFWERLVDYVGWSLPLILTTFVASSLAIAMLSSDTLRRIDVTEPVLAIVDREVRPMIQMLTGEEPNAFTMLGVKIKVRSMLSETVPTAKATLYAMGMARLFVLEIGPLLTALLLAGRIGGSYAGKVATMQATAQNKLLRVLGIHPVRWSLYPAVAAAVIAGPVLTVIGTVLSLVLAGYVGPYYEIGTWESYWKEVRATVLPDVRLKGFESYQAENSTTSLLDALYFHADYRTTYSSDYADTLIEIATYPPIYHVFKAVTFILIIMGVAETSARIKPNLTPRGVPAVITSAVVTGSLLVILADWWFSRLWLKRH